MSNSFNLVIMLQLGLLLVIYGIYQIIKYLKRGQVRFLSVWARKPLSFNKYPVAATLMLIAELIMIVGFIIIYIYVMFFE